MGLLEKLILEYKGSIRKLRTAKVKPLHSSSMISDAEFAVEYMTTGKIPGTKWAVARYSISRREIPMDPLAMASIIRNRDLVGPAPQWMVNLLDKLMLTLTEREMDAYKLVRGEGYSFAQAGKLLKCTKSTVQIYIHRAEKKIQQAVRRDTSDKTEVVL